MATWLRTSPAHLFTLSVSLPAQIHVLHNLSGQAADDRSPFCSPRTVIPNGLLSYNAYPCYIPAVNIAAHITAHATVHTTAYTAHTTHHTIHHTPHTIHHTPHTAHCTLHTAHTTPPNTNTDAHAGKRCTLFTLSDVACSCPLFTLLKERPAALLLREHMFHLCDHPIPATTWNWQHR